jgi:DNA-binding winged helix-turn-helix (wHTH) protein/tetratricopeptide (TPR) repeat protein
VFSASHLSFPPFRLDLENEQLWRDDKIVPMRPKPFAVLRYLVENPGRLVKREELRKAVWPDTHVSETLLRVHIRELRVALGDDADAPRIIETIPGRGYRFLASMSRGPGNAVIRPVRSRAPDGVHSKLIGRSAELKKLRNWISRTSNEMPQAVFITGEPGIGKSSLLNGFVEEMTGWEDVWIGRGQCVNHQGAGEAFLPLFDMLEHLCKSPDGVVIVDVLRRHAPIWLTQMAGVSEENRFESPRLPAQFVGQERMLRELGEALEQMSRTRIVMLAIEDLHWSDDSTLQWLDFFLRRARAPRVFILATFRTIALLARNHPLKSMIADFAGRYCHQLVLRPFDLEESVACVAQRIDVTAGSERDVAELGSAIYKRTEGNPLFVTSLVDSLSTNLQGAPTASRLLTILADHKQVIPDTIEKTIGHQLARLNERDRRVLQIASVNGLEFSAAAVEAAEERAPAQVEESLNALADQTVFLERTDEAEWPDGTISCRYRFRHSLYCELLYSGITAARRAQMHLRIAETMEQGFLARSVEIAGELARHFEEGRDPERAVLYREFAARNAWSRGALRETVENLSAALEISRKLEENPARIQQTLRLNVALGAALQRFNGWGAPEVAQTYERVEELCKSLAASAELVPALLGLWTYAIGSGQTNRALALAKRNLILSAKTADTAHLARAKRASGHSLFMLGRFRQARTEFEEAIVIVAKSRDQSRQPGSIPYSRNPAVESGGILAWALEMMGYSNQASQAIREALKLADSELQIHDMTSVASYAAQLYWIRRDWEALNQWSQRTAALANQHDLPYHRALAALLCGVALANQGRVDPGLELIRDGINSSRRMGTIGGITAMFLGWAEACQAVGKSAEGLEAVAQGLEFVESGDERAFESALYLARAELLLMQRKPRSQLATNKRIERQAEESFLHALRIANRQRARTFELRAALSLCNNLWKDRRARRQESLAVLKKACRTDKDLDTRELEAARNLLSELS